VPAGLTKQAVRFDPAIEPPRDEWFLAGTEQATIVRAHQAPPASLIAKPINGTVVALDPDIPPTAQKLRFVPARVLPSGWRWRLDGKVLGVAQPIRWQPWPGTHRLDLLDAAGATRETVGFEVRGARAKAEQTAQLK
jgi:penicillin-binding protein 1C